MEDAGLGSNYFKSTSEKKSKIRNKSGKINKHNKQNKTTK